MYVTEVFFCKKKKKKFKLLSETMLPCFSIVEGRKTLAPCHNGYFLSQAQTAKHKVAVLPELCS